MVTKTIMCNQCTNYVECSKKYGEHNLFTCEEYESIIKPLSRQNIEQNRDGLTCGDCINNYYCFRRGINGLPSSCENFKRRKPLFGMKTFMTILDEYHKHNGYTDSQNRFEREYNNTMRATAFVTSGCSTYSLDENFIMDVIFNPPATIVYWRDSTRTVVKAQDGEPFDPEKGLAMAFFKKMFGNTGSYNNIIKKRVENEYYKKKETPGNDLAFGYSEHSIKIDLPKDLTSEELDYMKQTIVRKAKLSLSTVKLLRYSSYAKREKCKSSDSK